MRLHAPGDGVANIYFDPSYNVGLFRDTRQTVSIYGIASARRVRSVRSGNSDKCSRQNGHTLLWISNCSMPAMVCAQVRFARRLVLVWVITRLRPKVGRGSTLVVFVECRRHRGSCGDGVMSH